MFINCIRSPKYNIYIFFLNFHKLYNYMYLSTGRTQTKNNVELGNVTHILYENPGIIVTLITFLLHAYLMDLFEFHTHEQTDF